MPRRARDCAEKAFYHVFARGNRRHTVFRDDEDRAWFMGRLEAVERSTAAIHVAHCLMNNHLHLVVGPGPRGISRLMHRVLGPYAQWFNHRHGTVGHLFQDRFGSRLIDSEQDLLSVVRYVHRNPVEAKMVARAEDWRWSSHAGHLEPRPPAHLQQGVELVRKAICRDSSRALRLYRAIVEGDGEPMESDTSAGGVGPDYRIPEIGTKDGGARRQERSLHEVSEVVERRFRLPEGCLASRRRDRRAQEARRAFCMLTIRSLGFEVCVVAAMLGRAPSTISAMSRFQDAGWRETETEGTVPAVRLRGIRNRKNRPRRSPQRRSLARVGG
jgi:REP element-mobilizing transposase RayT